MAVCRLIEEQIHLLALHRVPTRERGFPCDVEGLGVEIDCGFGMDGIQMNVMKSRLRVKAHCTYNDEQGDEEGLHFINKERKRCYIALPLIQSSKDEKWF